MNKSFFSTTLLFLTLFSHIISFGMHKHPHTPLLHHHKKSSEEILIITTLLHIDIKPEFNKHLPSTDIADMRLVCKEFAAKDLNWHYMPDSVYKQDKKITHNQTSKITPFQKTIVLLNLINQNDLIGVKWITNQTAYYHTENHFEISWTNNHLHSAALASMLSIHTKNDEMIHLIVTQDKQYKNQDWKTCYGQITVPSNMEQCLYPSYQYDFSFMPYLLATISNDKHYLEKLYSNKKPTDSGLRLLLGVCVRYNATDCLNFFIQHKQSKAIIKSCKRSLLKIALTKGYTRLAEQLIIKIFYRHQLINGHNEIIDLYPEDKEPEEVKNLLYSIVNANRNKLRIKF